MPLLTAADQIPGATAEAAPRRYWSSITPMERAMAAALGPAATAVKVYANHGRWVVECPDCHSAQMACVTDRRFMCEVCANVTVGGMWRPVTWPEERIEIDEILSARPLGNQNWLPGETVADLLAETPRPDVPTKRPRPRKRAD